MCRSIAEGGRRCKGKQRTTSPIQTTSESNQLVEALMLPDGGFTYSPLIGSPEAGYSVSPYPDRSRAINPTSKTSTALLSEISKYWKDNTPPLDQQNHYLGGWNDPETGIIYLDVSIVVPTSDEAHALCQSHDQIAFYDLSKGISVTVNQNATSGGANYALAS